MSVIPKGIAETKELISKSHIGFAGMIERESVFEILTNKISLSHAAASIDGHELSFLSGHDFVKCLDFLGSSNHLFSPKWRHCTIIVLCLSSSMFQSGDISSIRPLISENIGTKSARHPQVRPTVPAGTLVYGKSSIDWWQSQPKHSFTTSCG